MSLRRVVLSMPLVLIATASAWGARQATADRFDGRWSVLIITDSGSCDRAYRYGVEISGGHVFYNSGAGGPDVSISGQVDPRGRVSVSVRSGESAAYGSGRLSGATGGGTWQGTSQSSRCSGRWQAEREGQSTGTAY
jgi:hypothetical protein